MMADPEHKDKGTEDTQDIKKTPEYRRFKKLLKQVVKAPPMRQQKADQSLEPAAEESP